MTFARSRDMLMVGDDFEPKKFQATSLGVTRIRNRAP